MRNVFDKDAKITFSHVLLGKTKKSEIPAFKELLEDKLFSSDGQIFTFDALHTQSEILNTINEHKNKYIAKVDLPMDLADCSLVILAQKRNTKDILSIDSDYDVYRIFKKEPFNNLLNIYM